MTTYPIPSRRRYQRVAVATMLCACLPCCDAPWSSEPAISPPVSPSSLAPEARAPYPRGRWRLLTHEQLLRTSVWASHILVRHAEVATPNVSFSFADWRSSSSLPQRSRDEALALAGSIARQLQADPSLFGVLAARHSEDEATRTLGGSLGGRSALELVTFGEVLDALATLQPGQTSDVIETPYGFHVFQRQPLPEPELVSGAHLVIGYDDAGWLRNVVARGPTPSRSREAALAYARSLSERLRQAPTEFSAFVDRYSEHRDAAWGGDIGEWFTRTVTDFPREVQVLQELAVGEISAPLDSVFGFEILQRTPNGGRVHYAMEAVVLKFDASLPDSDASSRASIRRLADSIVEAVAADPSRLAEFRRMYCCKDTVRFDAGPEWPKVGEALSRLDFGAVSPPLESESQIIVARRVDPESLEPIDVNFDLSFIGPDSISHLLSRMEPDAAREQLKQIAAGARLVSSLDEAAQARWVDLHEQAAQGVAGASSPLQARAAVEELEASLRLLLGAEVYARYRSLMEEQLDRLVAER